MYNESQSIVRTRWVRATLLLLYLLISTVVCLLFYHFSNCIDGCGPYHNRASVADLDGDGDLDVVVSYLRHETETIVWAGAGLWINQGGGKFTPRSGEFGGPYTTAGDVNGDGNVDLLRWANDEILIHINYGEEDPIYGNFRVWLVIRPVEDPSNQSVTADGFIALGDLNGDGRLDAFFSNCCTSLIDKRDDFLPYLPWVWINTADENGYPKGVGLNLNSLGDLPMQPALGDLDGDGDLDVYVASLPPKGGNYDPSDRILLNDGSGAFLDSGQRLDNRRKAGSAASGAVALGDLDGDGDLDALVATANGAAIWINQGGVQSGQTGVFAESRQRLGRGHVEAVFLADFDGGGDLDALVAGKTQATIWWNDGYGEFRRSDVRFEYKESAGMAVGDFDGDGDQDIYISGNQDDYQVWWNDDQGSFKAGNRQQFAPGQLGGIRLAPRKSQGDGYGEVVDVHGDVLTVGAPGNLQAVHDGQRGALYVFEYNGASWIETTILTPSLPTQIAEVNPLLWLDYGGIRPRVFGSHVALEDDTLAIGGDIDGTVYIYQRGGDGWQEQAHIVIPCIPGRDFSMTSMSLFGDVLSNRGFDEKMPFIGLAERN